MLVCEEVPNIKSLPFDKAVQKHQVIEMVRRDRNHPSIVMWSMGNETNNAADGAWALAEDDTRLIHYRHVKGAFAGAPFDHTQLEMENLLRCSIRGWFDDDMPADRGPQRNGQVTGTEELQHRDATVPPENGRFWIGSKDNVVVWLYADHGCDRQYLHAPLYHQNPKGWVDAYRVPKYIYYRWQANFTRDLMVFIHPHDWTRRFLGETRSITIDSNGTEVELFCGEASLGTARPCPENAHCVVFDAVPVQEAVLRAVARRGTVSVEHRLPMAGPAARLTLEPSHTSMPARRASVVLLTVGIEDEAGRRVHGANPSLHWDVDGPANLAAPVDWVSDRDRHHAREGLMYIDLPVRVPFRSTGEPGTVRVRVSADGLDAASAQIEATACAETIVDGVALPPPPACPPWDPAVRPCRDRPIALGLVFEDALLPGDGAAPMRDEVCAQLRKWFGDDACERPGVASLIDALEILFVNGNGRALADDINSAIGEYNRKQLIGGEV
jgi:hypothetical protein